MENQQTYEHLKRKELKKYAEENPDESQHINQLYSTFRNNVLLVADPDINQQSLLIEAPPGLGKTYQIKKTLVQNHGVDEISYNSGHLTPAELYELLYKGRDKTIVLDDIEGIASSKSAVSILKAAVDTEGDLNFVQWNSKSSKINAPPEFPFEGRIIMVFNDLPDPNKNGDIKALVNRSIFHKVNFTYQERIEIIAEVARTTDYDGLTKDEQLEAAEWFIRNTNPEYEGVNIRMLESIYDKYVFSKSNPDVSWKDMASNVFDFNEELKTVRELLQEYQGMDGGLDEAKYEYVRETGKDERTWYRKRKKVNLEQLDKEKALEMMTQ